MPFDNPRSIVNRLKNQLRTGQLHSLQKEEIAEQILFTLPYRTRANQVAGPRCRRSVRTSIDHIGVRNDRCLAEQQVVDGSQSNARLMNAYSGIGLAGEGGYCDIRSRAVTLILQAGVVCSSVPFKCLGRM